MRIEHVLFLVVMNTRYYGLTLIQVITCLSVNRAFKGGKRDQQFCLCLFVLLHHDTDNENIRLYFLKNNTASYYIFCKNVIIKRKALPLQP